VQQFVARAAVDDGALGARQGLQEAGKPVHLLLRAALVGHVLADAGPADDRALLVAQHGAAPSDKPALAAAGEDGGLGVGRKLVFAQGLAPALARAAALGRNAALAVVLAGQLRQGPAGALE
jgi:hypothetical protein